MAEEDSGQDDRTEDASQQKRDEWKKEGNVAQSKELVAALLLLATTAAVYGASNLALTNLWNFFTDSFNEVGRLSKGDWNSQTVHEMLRYSLKGILVITAPVFLAAVFSSVLGSVAQFGLIFTTKPLEFDPDKINPMNGFQKIFSKQGIFEVIKATIKLSIMISVLYLIFKSWVFEVGTLWNSESEIIAKFIGEKGIHLLIIVAFGMLIVAGLDFSFQKFQYEQKIKMTKQEVKEERKQTEGNPQIKARIRALQKSVATRRMKEAVKKADVVVTNPTHIAVALIYDREAMLAPKVVAKGADFMAEQIKKIARENGIPCVENVPLARAMYKALKVGQFITRDLYNAVAEVLAYVYRIKGNLNRNEESRL